jgi:hypothetical protein
MASVAVVPSGDEVMSFLRIEAMELKAEVFVLARDRASSSLPGVGIGDCAGMIV